MMLTAAELEELVERACTAAVERAYKCPGASVCCNPSWYQFNAELHAKNTALSREVLDLRQALGDLLTAHAMRASCQAGMVDRCKCVGCATTRARVALGA